MAKIFANLIMFGRKTINDVPQALRKEVKKILKDKGYPID